MQRIGWFSIRGFQILIVAMLLSSLGWLDVDSQAFAAPPQITGDCVNLFTPSFARVTLSAADQIVARPGSLQIVSANTQAVNAQRVAAGQAKVICVQLTPNRVVRGQMERAALPTNNSFEWVGHLEEIPFSQMVLVGNQGALAGHINTPGGAYTLRYTSAGVYAFYAVNEAAFPNDAHPTIPPEGYEAPSTQRALADDGSIIDVMVLYTPEAKNGAGGQAAMDALVDMAIAQTNTAFQSSLVNTRYRLVYKGEIAYTEGGNSNDDLSRLQNAADGFMDDAHALRDQYGADLVHLITERSQYCGLGYQLTGGDAGSSPTFAFALTVRTCAVDNMTFAHEGGHNMGAAHDRANQPDGGSYPYSFAYRYPTKYRTIMAYATGCANPCGKAPYFSNPNVSHQGLPTGVAEGDPNAADNAKTFNKKAVTIANYRTSINTPTCFTLTTNAVNGSVNRNQNPNCNNATQYISGTLVSLTAAPNATYAFSNWTGDVPSAPNTTNPINIVMGANANVTANFERCYNLTTTVAGGSATITTNPLPNCDNGARFKENTVVTLMTNVNGDTTFVSWGGDASGSNVQTTVTMDANKNAIANVNGCVSLTILNDPVTGGFVARSVPPGGPDNNRCTDPLQYRAGTTVSLTPTAAVSHTFLYWRGAVLTTTESIALTLDRDVNLTSNYLSVVGSNDTITNARNIALSTLCIPACSVYLPLVIRGGSAPRIAETPSATQPMQRTLRTAATLTQTQSLVFDDIIDTSNATDDSNDPRLCSGGTGTATVWYQFTAPTTGTLEIDTNGTNYDTVIALWEGTPGSTGPMFCDDDSGADRADSYLLASVQGGKTYYVIIADALPPDEDIPPPLPPGRVRNYGGILFVSMRFTPYNSYQPRR